MRFIFFGTPRFADIVLEHLLAAQLIPTALVANPDRPVGRKHTLTSPPTVMRIRDSLPQNTVQIFQPEKLDTSLISRLSSLQPDFFIVAAYAKIIPQDILSIPRLGTIGVHPSLLPALRGASPIQSAILTNATETGVTLYLMDEKMDHGPILAQKILTDTDLQTIFEPDLEEKLAHLSGSLLAQTLSDFFAGSLSPHPQKHDDATFTKKFTTDNAAIPLEELRQAESGKQAETAQAIHRKIRAFVTEPGAWTTLPDGRRVKLLASNIIDNALSITRLQFEGERPKPWHGPLIAP